MLLCSSCKRPLCLDEVREGGCIYCLEEKQHRPIVHVPTLEERLDELTKEELRDFIVWLAPFIFDDEITANMKGHLLYFLADRARDNDYVRSCQ